jgi:hypothetical protein
MTDAQENSELKSDSTRKRSRRVQKETFLYSRIVPLLFVLLVLGLVVILLIVALSILGVIPAS